MLKKIYLILRFCFLVILEIVKTPYYMIDAVASDFVELFIGFSTGRWNPKTRNSDGTLKYEEWNKSLYNFPKFPAGDKSNGG